MNILVTGGLGFIGSNIAERLLREGHDVWIIDNFHTGSEVNIEEMKNNGMKIKGKLQEVMRADAGQIEKVTAGRRFDVIFHNGIYSSTPMYRENPVLTAKVIEDWILLLEYARKTDAKVVYASTSSLYNGQKPPHRENMSVTITDFYSEARVMMERLAQLYKKMHGLKPVGLRYFSVYGPHEISKKKYANLISQFMWDLKAGRQPIVYGDGTQTRDFTYVEDIVEANMLAIKYPECDVFNTGTGTSITIKEMLVVLGRMMNSPPELEAKFIINPIKNYVQHTMANTEKAEKLLKFKAKHTLEQGIAKLIQYYSTRQTP